MAAKVGVRRLFGPYFRKFHFIAPIPELFFCLGSIPKQKYVYSTTPASQGNSFFNNVECKFPGDENIVVPFQYFGKFYTLYSR